jgi:xylulokinase
MTLLGLDVGSSSVKAGLLRDGKLSGMVARAFFPTKRIRERVEVDPAAILRAVRGAIASLGQAATRVDAIALDVMSPSWVVMDAKGKALTPVVTHQDRRSVEEAKRIEQTVGKDRHLRLTGNRPTPGGIASTTWAWFMRHEPERLKRADLAGMLSTFLHRRMTGARVTDPSNASFTGLYRTVDLAGWSDDLCDAAEISRALLPEVVEGNAVAGKITRAAAREFGLREGTPMAAGVIDGSAGMLLAGAVPGQLFNVCGSTDVLALCTNRPRPHEQLLTRALGVNGLWLSVSTLAAAGAALFWAKQQLFPDLSQDAYRKLMSRLAPKGDSATGGVTFDPYLAGERTRVEQRRGAFTGLTLATTREQMLAAMIDALAKASAARLALLKRQNDLKIALRVVVSGGKEDRHDKLMHRDWPKGYTFQPEVEATLRGLGRLSIVTQG